MGEHETKRCVACGARAHWNPRDEWWRCWECGFSWEEGPWGVSWVCKDGLDELPGRWSEVPAWALPALGEAEAG